MLHGEPSVVHIKQRNCGKRQYITAGRAVEAIFYTQTSAFNCITKSEASEGVVNNCKSIPELVPCTRYIFSYCVCSELSQIGMSFAL
jgi:hypothetical protein